MSITVISHTAPSNEYYSQGPRCLLLVFLKMTARLDPDMAFTKPELIRRLPMVKKSYWCNLTALWRQGYLARSVRQGEQPMYEYKLGERRSWGGGTRIEDKIKSYNPDLWPPPDHVLTLRTTRWTGEELKREVESVKVTGATISSLRAAAADVPRSAGAAARGFIK